MNLNTPIPNTWCPGCSNFMILSSAKKAVADLVREKWAKQRDFVTVTGIGCHAKFYDYINTGGFYGLHGRAIPAANGIVLGNPELKVMVFAGDGDAYAEGISHFVHAARMNPNYALFVHNNQVFALTTGQFTPTTEKGFPGKSTPQGNPFVPMNPVAMALEAGAGFVAREYALDVKNLVSTMKKAIKHKGFAFVDIIQPCVTFHDVRGYMKGKTYRVKPMKLDRALKEARKWDYSLSPRARIPMGVFYRKRRTTLEEAFGAEAWHKKHPKRPLNGGLWAKFKA
jgi:2-oxoglutarate/2-oxoacid ferredoxin oxidoreductase subunit beta